MTKGKALHTIDELIHQLRRASFDENIENESSVLGNSFRDSRGELLEMDFVPTSGINPFAGRSEKNVIQADGSTTSALYAAPVPCTGSTATAMKIIPQDLAAARPEIRWNYSPIVSAKTITDVISDGYFSTICVYFEANFKGIDINTSPDKKSALNKVLSVPGLSGVTCDNCFAYVGAQLQVALLCTTGGINECHFGLSAGGGALLNLDLNIVNPSLNYDSGYLPLYNTSTYSTLYSNPAAFFKIKAKPTFYVRLDGQISAKGKASLKANLNATAGVQVVASSPRSIGVIGAGFSGHISMSKPTFASTLQLSDASLSVYLTPLVSWQFEVGQFISVLGKESGFSTTLEVGTAFTANYNFIQKSSTKNGPGKMRGRALAYTSTSCASNHDITVVASLEDINEKFLLHGSGKSNDLLSGSISTGDQLAYSSSPGETCLSAPPPPPTFTPTTRPSGADANPQVMSALRSGKINNGVLMLVILLPFVFLLLLFICLRNWCKKHGENSLPKCLPLDCRQRASDCFVSRRRESQRVIIENRNQDEDAVRQQQQQMQDAYNLQEAYERESSLNSVHLSDIVPSPLIGGIGANSVGLSKLPLHAHPKRISVEATL